MYKIIGADQKEYGPSSAEELRQWVREGRADGRTLVQAEGATEWKPLASFPELAAALGESPFAAAPPPFTPASQPADPTVLPDDILERDYELDIGGCVTRSWSMVQANLGTVVGAVFVYVLIQIAISLIVRIPVLGILFSLANLIISGPLMSGLYYFLLKNVRREPAELGDIFAGFGARFVQLLLVYLAQAFITCLAIFPGAVLALIGALPIIRKQVPDGTHILLTIIGGILVVLPAIYLSTCWLFSLILSIDKQVEFWRAMQTSRTVVRKHWWMVFGLIVVSGLINVISILLCCVPILIGAPVAFGALVYAYEDLFGHRAAPKA